MNIKIICSIIPSIIFALIIYASDKKEKEPITELLKALAFGFAATSLTLLLSYPLGIGNINLKESNIFEILIYSFIAVALVEELCKFVCSYLVVRKNSNFNYMYDGVVYFSFVALGFATLENILYASFGTMEVLLTRAITTVPAHIMFGIISGYYFSIYKKNKLMKKSNKEYLLLSIAIPILLHGFYDFCLLTDNYIFYFIYIAFVAILYTYAISRAIKLEKEDRKI